MSTEEATKETTSAPEEKPTEEKAPQDKPEADSESKETSEPEKKEEEKAEDVKKEDSADVEKKEEPEKKEDSNEEPKEEEKTEEKPEEKSDEKPDEKPEEKSESNDEANDEAKDDKKEVEEVAATPTPKKRGRKKKGEGGATPTSALKQDSVTPVSGKRARKSASRLSSELANTPSKKEFIVPVGRGVKLDSIESVKAKVKVLKKDDVILREAHGLLFSVRGRPKQNLIKKHILSFSGYLPPVEGEKTEKEIEADDEEFETKMSVKAFKLTVLQLKNLISLFDIKAEGMDKESLVDCLLDFLGAPDAKLTKGLRKKRKSNGTSKSPKKKQKAKDTDVEMGDETEEDDSVEHAMEVEENDLKTGKMPSDAKLRKWVKAYVACFNLDKATTKHAIETASDKFGVDMTSKKAKIKMLLANELS